MNEKCKETVYDPRDSWSRGQRCSRKAGESGYCKQHDPVNVAERARLSREKYDAEWAERRRKAAIPAMLRDALHQIANGHNDPRALALETLEKAK